MSELPRFPRLSATQRARMWRLARPTGNDTSKFVARFTAIPDSIAKFGFGNRRTINALRRAGMLHERSDMWLSPLGQAWIDDQIEQAHALAMTIDPFTSEQSVKTRVAAIRYAIERVPSTVTPAQRAEVERADARIATTEARNDSARAVRIAAMSAAEILLAWVLRALESGRGHGMPTWELPPNSVTATTLTALADMGLITADRGADGTVTGIGYLTPAAHDWFRDEIGAAQSEALVERCARLKHRHVAKWHPRPDLEAVATALTCYARNFAGMRVEFHDGGEWVPAEVTTMMYRGDGFVLRALDEIDRPVRVPFARLRLPRSS